MHCIGGASVGVEHLVRSNGGVAAVYTQCWDSSFANDMQRALVGKRQEGSFVVWQSRELAMSSIVGPVGSVTTTTQGATSTTVVMGGSEPKHGYALYYELEEDIVAPFAYFQFAVTAIDLEKSVRCPVQRSIVR